MTGGKATCVVRQVAVSRHGVGRRARAGRSGRAGERARQACGVAGAWGAAGTHKARGRGAAWARCWPMGYALGALSLFLARFDSVLFLSQFLDIVREPGS